MTTDEGHSTDTPCDQLVSQISSDLRAQGLFDDDTLQAIERKLTSGKISSEDWRLWCEQQLARKTSDEPGRSNE
jgi:hypothetical protein